MVVLAMSEAKPGVKPRPEESVSIVIQNSVNLLGIRGQKPLPFLDNLYFAENYLIFVNTLFQINFRPIFVVEKKIW